MYTKVFQSIYEGTLADNWQALVTFQQLLILANDEGVVDMTINSIHRRTGIPTDILEMGIKVLEAPDQGSRTPDMEGRRIARLEEHRDWGWFLVNFQKYRQMTTREEKKEADRARMRDRRNSENTIKSNTSQNVAECSEVSQNVAARSVPSRTVADVAYTEADTDKRKEHAPRATRLPADWRPTAEEIRWAETERPDLDVVSEIENFRDFWHAKSGKDATKASWPLTFKVWIRRANAKFKPRNRRGELFDDSIPSATDVDYHVRTAV